MKNKAKLLSIILTLALLISALPITALADEPTPFYVGNSIRYADADDSLSTGYLTAQVDNITMEAWVKADTLPEVSACIRIMYNGDSGSRGYGIYLVNNKPCILMGGVNFASVSDVSLNTSQWYHLAAVRASGVWKLYINGAEYTPTCSTSAPNALAPTDTFTVGNSSYHENFTGSIDEVRFWTVARTADEIRNNMYVKLNGTESGLLAYYNFDQAGITPGGDNTAITTVTDVAGGDQNLAVSGFALTGDTSNFVESVNLGTFELESTAYSVRETAGNVTIPIVRTGGSEGSVTINYVTANDSAYAGTNYTATSGSVTFAEGETSKSIQVPVINQFMSNTRTFTFSISGQEGIGIGSNSSALVTITPGCTMPTVMATGGKFTLGAPGSVDLYSSVTAATNDDGQTFTGATLSVAYFRDTTEYLTVDGTDIPLINGASGTFSAGNYHVTGTGTLLSVVLSGMSLDNTAMAALIDGIMYKNSAAPATAGNRVIRLEYVNDSGGGNNQSAVFRYKATVIVGNILSPDSGTMDIFACAGGDVIRIGAGRSVTLDGNSTALTNVQIYCEAGVTLTLKDVCITDTTIGYSPVTFTGENNTLIVTGENNLSAGAAAPGVDVSGAALRIRGTGSLTARGIATTAGYGGAGIGTTDGATYDIDIESGNITAIAGATNTRGANIMLSPGISAADISITGGTVTASGYYGCAGIGSGGSADGSSITISGGVVTATAAKFSVAIGCTSYAARSDDKIASSGGRVIATCSPILVGSMGVSYATGAGIGDSAHAYNGTGGTIELTGGEIFAGFAVPSGYTAGGYDIGDASISLDNTNWTVSIGGSAKVFLFNNRISGLTTSTHVNKTYDAGTAEVFGVTIPEGWQSAGFGAYLRSCTLSYDINGGSGTAPASVTQLYGTTVTLSDGSGLSRANYHFGGWNTAADGTGTNYAAGSNYTLAADTVTLYAQWTAEDSGDSTPTKTIAVTETSSGLFSGSGGQIKAEANMNSAFSNSVEVKVTDTEQNASNFGLGAGSEVYPFDISLYISGTNTKTEPASGYAVTISLPVPDKLLDVKEQLSIVHKSDDGTVTTLASQLRQTNGVWYFVFEATEFSPYALVVSGTETYDETAGLPYYLDANGKEMFIGFAVNGKYIAPSGVTVLLGKNAKSFTDIGSHWAKDYIGFVTERELFTGTGENRFEPDAGMTRAMFASIIGRLYERSYGEITAASNGAFIDVDYGGWYGKYVNWAADNGIITGIGGGLFAPDREITRQEMAVILYRFADFLGGPTGDTDTVITYPDSGAISSWAESAALYCQITGIITGRDGGSFVPQDTATRAEAAVILERFIENTL